ncbi:hypothetical protein [Latilactobacillus sakei]|uniref:hypothetical protein n=1 Tax=Latilactobacillus sakei TaxID=1599 RepID=UPI00115764FD|nr:hypothetical protein [Latilactobacillus sakei]MCP8853914.1 hypothetical protein [Latilactobacillus sakei]VTU54844.1 Hypothetical extracellular protein precursor [Lactobacillus sakei subsp. sakei 23K] [Latilactobacillus sakei]
MNLMLAVILYFGLAIFGLGLLLLLFLLIFKKSIKAALVIALIGLLVAAAPVGYQYYLSQKAAHEAQVKLEKREKSFNKHERQFLKHIKQATASTEYVAQKYTATWETLIKDGSVTIGDSTYTDNENAIAGEGRRLVAKGKLDDADNYYAIAQTDYESMKDYKTSHNKERLVYAKNVLAKTNAFILAATRPNSTYQDYADDIYKTNKSHVRAIDQLKNARSTAIN